MFYASFTITIKKWKHKKYEEKEFIKNNEYNKVLDPSLL